MTQGSISNPVIRYAFSSGNVFRSALSRSYQSESMAALKVGLGRMARVVFSGSGLK